MKKKIAKWSGYLFVMTFLICSCAGTEITEKQVDTTFKGRPVSNILVIAITGVEHKRQSFENQFVAQLNAVGVAAVSSAEVIPMPADLVLKKETILDAVNQNKNDAVIISHLVGKEVKDVYTRGERARGGFYGFYQSRYMHTHEPGYSSTSTTVRLETNLYDVKTEKLIWSGQSKTLSSDSSEQIIHDVIKTVISSLQKEKMIAPEE
jgi:hypothetical protein